MTQIGREGFGTSTVAVCTRSVVWPEASEDRTLQSDVLVFLRSGHETGSSNALHSLESNAAKGFVCLIRRLSRFRCRRNAEFIPSFILNISKLSLKSAACKTEGSLQEAWAGWAWCATLFPPAFSGFLYCSHQTNLCFSLWIIRECH